MDPGQTVQFLFCCLAWFLAQIFLGNPFFQVLKGQCTFSLILTKLLTDSL